MLPSELKLTCLRHCYIHLPDSFITKESNVKPGDVISIRSIQHDTEIFVMWNGQVAPGGQAQIDVTFGQANNFRDELVVLCIVDRLELTDCSQCTVELLEAKDVTILTQHLDANVLDSCRLVTRGLVIPIYLSQHVSVLVRVLSIQPNEQYGLLNKFTEMQFHHNLPDTPRVDKGIENSDVAIDEPVPFVSCGLGIDYKLNFHFGSVLICGERGSGKTHWLKSTILKYKRYHAELFNCKQLRGKRPESIKKKFAELLSEAIQNQPAILGLDDIDSIVCNDSKHEDEKGQEIIYKKRLVDAFCHLLKQLERLSSNNSIVVIATCRSIESLDDRLSKPVGRQYFNEIIEIEPPKANDRVDILKNIIAQHKQVESVVDEAEFQMIAEKCGSFMPSDLRKLVERSIINACSRSLMNFNAERLSIQYEDLLESLNNYVPYNLRGVSLQPKTIKTFDDVGGMEAIKDQLMRTIILQVKYPKLYRKSPIKPQNSILLYGPPGCGKTLVAEALTNQECINSICVRGPELLSKYIGASEAAVRDLFRRAELARPCIIFFDEFESLVSRRGSDSTGVTDRVVNQFLTLMDGVERLSNNVFIVAASSRPDMIDAAILRPGRLDRHIYCPIPSREDRLGILRVLTRDLAMHSLDLRVWSERLDGFTGADIQSFLYSAQLKALHDLIGPVKFDAQETAADASRKDIEIVVNESHFERSYEEMKDSVRTNHVRLQAQYPKTIRRPSERVASRATLA